MDWSVVKLLVLRDLQTAYNSACNYNNVTTSNIMSYMYSKIPVNTLLCTCDQLRGTTSTFYQIMEDYKSSKIIRRSQKMSLYSKLAPTDVPILMAAVHLRG